MSDYARAGSGGATHFGDKDALTTGDADKVIVGAQFDSEFNAILTACNSKYDSADVASQAQAEGETLNGVLCTPLSLRYWSDANAGIVGEIHALADPNADGLIGWDDGAAADSNVVFFTAGTGMAISGTTFEMSHLGFEDLVDPNVDALSGWDDTLGYFTWWTAADGLEFTNAAGTFGITDVAVSTTFPVSITAGTFAWDSSSITEISATGLSQSADGFLVDNAGVLNVMPVDQVGWPLVDSDAAQDVSLTLINTIQTNSGTAARTWSIDTNAIQAGIAIGTGFLILNTNATYDLTIDAKTGVTLESIYHAGGVDDASDIVRPGGSAVLYKVGTDAWALSGDISDA